MSSITAYNILTEYIGRYLKEININIDSDVAILVEWNLTKRVGRYNLLISLDYKLMLSDLCIAVSSPSTPPVFIVFIHLQFVGYNCLHVVSGEILWKVGIY